MKKIAFVDPFTHEPLSPKKVRGRNALVSTKGATYWFKDGLPDLTYPKTLSGKERHTLSFYENRAAVYDQFLYQTFKTHGENEKQTRMGFIDRLNLEKNSRVLEVACGTGRDSALISKRLGRSGELVLQDISPAMLSICQTKLRTAKHPSAFCISNAAYLPFPDRHFDATYSFGGLGEFPDIRRSLAEMVRVTKVGGKVVVGDESIPPWLRETYFYKVLVTTNPQFQAEVPLDQIPVQARKLNLQWVIGGTFYLIDFEVGDGEPTGEFDYEIEGPRGGTLRTRYEGQLEGVTPEAKKLALAAASKKRVSLHRWLDKVVRDAAKDEVE